VVWSRLSIRWPFLVWLAAAIGAAFMFFYGAHTGGMMGFVEIIEHPIAAVEIGRVADLKVQVGQPVRAGELVARLDTSAVDAEIAAEDALKAEAAVSVPSQDQVALQLERQFGVALATAQAALDDQRIRQAQDAAEAKVLKAELDRLEGLLQQRLIEASVAAQLRARQAALVDALALYETTLPRLEARVAEVLRQQEEARTALRPAAGGAGTNFLVRAQDERMRSLTARRDQCLLTAPVDGVIGQLHYRPGDVVPAGLPVVTLVESHPANVIALIPEINAREFREGQPVRVERTYGLGQTYPGSIVTLEPAVRGLPGQVTPMPGRVIRGRRAVCRLDGPHDLLPGETVEVRVSLPFWDPVLGWLRKFLGS
jgi:HlyD family secretion protein